MLRQVVCLIGWSAVTAVAQMEHAPAPLPGLQTGLVVQAEADRPLSATDDLGQPGGAALELQDFALSLTLHLKAWSAGEVLQLKGVDASLSLSLAADGSVNCRWGDWQWSARPQQQPLNRPLSVVLSVKRDARQALASFSLDGVEHMALAVPPGKFTVSAKPLRVGAAGLSGTVAQVRLYNRNLTRPEVLDLALLAAPAKPKLRAFEQGLTLAAQEVIAVLGGSEAVALQEEGTFESLLLARFPGQEIKLRDLAWETDTVWQQDRPMNFGELRQQLARVDATCVLLMFGRQECLERGEAGVPAFRAALEALVTRCTEVTPRLWLVGPAPFGAGTAPLPDLSRHNAALKHYNDAIRDVAAAHHAVFTDVFSSWGGTRDLTLDGLNLNAAGLQKLATSAADPAGTIKDARALRPLIRVKNQLWHDYWRPSNWAFLYGDRTAQPSSRDHLNPGIRWFPAELEKYHALINAKEQELWKRSEAMGRKLP